MKPIEGQMPTTQPKKVPSAVSPKVGGPADRFGMTLKLHVGIPNTYSSFEIAVTYESSPIPSDGGDLDKTARRVRDFVEHRLALQKDRVFKELDLLDDAAPKKGLKWRSTSRS